MPRLDVPLTKLRAEPLQGTHLVVAQAQVPLPHRLLQPQEPLMPGEQVVAAPHPTHPAPTDLHATQHQLLRHPQRPLRGLGQAVVQDGRLHRLVHPVGVRPPGARRGVLECGPRAPGSRSGNPSEPNVWKLRRIS